LLLLVSSHNCQFPNHYSVLFLLLLGSSNDVVVSFLEFV
jgi:hypothetical protein